MLSHMECSTLFRDEQYLNLCLRDWAKIAILHKKKFACVQLFESMADEVPPEQLVVLISLTSIAKET